MRPIDGDDSDGSLAMRAENLLEQCNAKIMTIEEMRSLLECDIKLDKQ